ncbi:MAG: ferrous iron transporter B [Eubacteriales bacterium]
MRLRLSLTGNPNCGKTTLYNALTGEEESVGNWSGVTVTASEVEMKTDYGFATIVDLPGTYSLDAYTQEESLTLSYINPDKSDVIVNIVDITSLSRSLYFTTQLLELGIPMIVALNKIDIMEEEVDTRALALALGCPVIPISAERGDALREMVTLSATASKPAKRKHITEESQRFAYIQEILAQVCQKKEGEKSRKGEKWDKIFMAQGSGLPLYMGLVMSLMLLCHQLNSFSAQWIQGLFGSRLTPLLLQFEYSLPYFWGGLLVEGIFGGLAVVLRFLPVMLFLFFFLSVAEDSGYLARVTVLMDCYFKKIGLTGKAILPLVVGGGNTASGILATRAMEEKGQAKRLGIMMPLVISGDKLPLLLLFSAVFFQRSWAFILIMTLIMVALLFAEGLLLKKLFGAEGDTLFIMELPQYRYPRPSLIFKQMMGRTVAFLKNATVIILLWNSILWILQSISFTGGRSVLELLGSAFSPIFLPLGLGAWQVVILCMASCFTKENALATLSFLYAGEIFVFSHSNDLYQIFTPLTAFSFLMFYLFSSPSLVAMKIMYQELKFSFGVALGLQFFVGYALAFVTYQLGTLIGTGALGAGYWIGLLILGALGYFLYLGREHFTRWEQM